LEKAEKFTKQLKGESSMIKRLVVMCCILLLPTIAAAEGTTNYGDFWVGGQVGALWTTETRIEVAGPFFNRSFNLGTEPGVTAGAIVGYNFCMPYRQPWERYFGVALDFQWNQFRQDKLIGREEENNGNQFALALLGRLQYPLMGSERFTRGRIVPFVMFGPAIVWTNSDFGINGSSSKTSTNFGLVAEVGAEFFICPQLSIGPSFRFRHVWGPNYSFGPVDFDSNLNQFTLLGRLAWHF
jgi:opacity protein-like surface antigen